VSGAILSFFLIARRCFSASRTPTVPRLISHRAVFLLFVSYFLAFIGFVVLSSSSLHAASARRFLRHLPLRRRQFGDVSTLQFDEFFYNLLKMASFPCELSHDRPTHFSQHLFGRFLEQRDVARSSFRDGIYISFQVSRAANRGANLAAFI
jgi:hypothetical protein